MAAEATFDNMKRLSTTPAYAGSVLAPTDASNPDTYKVRQGASAGELFAHEDLDLVDRLADEALVNPEATMSCRGEPPRRRKAG